MRGWLFAIYFFSLAAAPMAFTVPTVRAQPGAPVTARVAATNEAWTDTGIELREGDAASIHASGVAGWNPRVLSGPEGSRTEICGVTVPQAPLGALVGRVGDRPPVVVRADTTLTGPGRVALLYNDCPGQYFDNTGGFDVRLAVTPAVSVATPATVADAVSAPEPAGAAGGGTWRALLGAGGLLLGAGALAYMVADRRRRRRIESAREASAALIANDPAPLPVPPGIPRAPVAPAVLKLCGGPLAGQQVSLTDAPITIGTALECSLVLPNGSAEVEPQHARVWHRDGRYMLHRLARRGVLTLCDKPVQWAVLEPDDQFAIGPHRFSFHLE
jgi:hypothetical protein